ncbi:PepSY domain-containing protein [Inmirania thermothiophila]|uniref:Peptidase YpeB-like protein n=1 Tax=Inmirania thermothiophila TaxID=1750597 RepID=A0A3N1Y563_9GAMM|nr:PepSY domain-containing protein [Inmirania thermothiophila]ROR32772.1 peptidase YpeB-like protein [Inmirania thermothiophila]
MTRPRHKPSPLRRRLAALVLVAAAAQAAPLTLEEAARAAARASGGRVLAAETVRRDGHAVYRIRVLTPEGRVRHLEVDPESGRIRPARTGRR